MKMLASCFRIAVVLALSFLVCPELSASLSEWSFVQITDNAVNDYYPDVYDGSLAFIAALSSEPNPLYDTYFWNGQETINVTNNGRSYGGHSLFGNSIAFSQLTGQGNSTQPAHGADWRDAKIYLWNGTDMELVSSDGVGCYDPSLWDGKVAWADRAMDAGRDIFYYDGEAITNVSDSPRSDLYPSLWNGRIAWSGRTPQGDEIFYSNGTTVQRITNNWAHDYFPSLYGGRIAWYASDGNDYEIYVWKNGVTTQLTDNDYNDSRPSVFKNYIAWTRYDGAQGDIYLYDGTTIHQVTDTSFTESSVDLYLSRTQIQIAYEAYIDGDREIMYAYARIPEPSAILLACLALALLSLAIGRKS